MLFKRKEKNKLKLQQSQSKPFEKEPEIKKYGPQGDYPRYIFSNIDYTTKLGKNSPVTFNQINMSVYSPQSYRSLVQNYLQSSDLKDQVTKMDGKELSRNLEEAGLFKESDTD
jgi:hypothetical protein